MAWGTRVEERRKRGGGDKEGARPVLEAVVMDAHLWVLASREPQTETVVTFGRRKVKAAVTSSSLLIFFILFY